MGAQLGGSSSARAMSEINVTPLVDVMLVLLIIFMVTAPLMQQGVTVDLPQSKGKALDAQQERFILSVHKDRSIFVGETEIPYAELREKLVGNVKLQRDKQLFLKADRSLPYGYVVDIMSVVKDAGVTNIGMVTNPDSAKDRQRR